ncbi:MAG: TRAP transporter small permease [Rhodospirillales bacterium]|nr:TRAP transporter small permease [Rhodospirillales bacterium]
MAAVGLAIMMFLTLFDVVGRAFDHPIAGTVEVTELIMGMMIYLAIGYTTFLRGHIRVDIVITHLSPRVQAYLDLITITIGLIFAGLISWRLFLQAQSRVSNNDLTQIWEWPVWPAAWVMAIASLLMVTSLALHLGLTAKAAFGGTNNGPGASGPAPYSE